MIPEYGQFVVFFLVTVALLKIGASYFQARFPGSPVGNALNWFVAPA